MNRLKEMWICLKEQGYYTLMNGRIYIDFMDYCSVKDILIREGTAFHGLAIKEVKV